MAKPPNDDSVAVVDSAAVTGEVVTRNDEIMQTFTAWLVDRAQTNDDDQYAIMAAIIGEIMQAENVAEALAERSTAKAKDLLDRPLILHGFEIREGDYEESAVGFYAALTVSAPGVDMTRVVTCGGTKVLARLFALDKFGEWPQMIMFKAKKTSKGYEALDIVTPSV